MWAGQMCWRWNAVMLVRYSLLLLHLAAACIYPQVIGLNCATKRHKINLRRQETITTDLDNVTRWKSSYVSTEGFLYLSSTPPVLPMHQNPWFRAHQSLHRWKLDGRKRDLAREKLLPRLSLQCINKARESPPPGGPAGSSHHLQVAARITAWAGMEFKW